MSEHLSWFEINVPYTGDVVDQRPPACGMISPSGAMLCDLPKSGVRHLFAQHVGVDRNGNFRGWKDTR